MPRGAPLPDIGYRTVAEVILQTKKERTAIPMKDTHSTDNTYHE